MITKLENRGEGMQRAYHLTFAFAVVLLLCVFGLLLPSGTYLCGTIMTVYDAEMPLLASFLVELSPWAPILIAIVGVTTLIAKERSWSARSAFKLNVATIAAVVVVGGMLALGLFHPIFALMQALG